MARPTEHSRPLKYNNRLWIYYRADMRVRKLSEWTITNYFQSLLAADGYFKRDFLTLTKLDLKEFIAQDLKKTSDATARIHYVGLRVFFNFLVREELIPKSPLAGVTGPEADDKPPRIPTVKEIKALLGACSGKTLRDRRDNALIRLMLEPGGPRKAEIMGIQLSDVDFDEQVISIHGKGGKVRLVPYGAKTSQALMRYVTLRERHKAAHTPALWVGKYGAMTYDALPSLLKTRCRQAGISYINPHKLRHFSADESMQAGFSDLDMMTLFGWSNPKMLEVYARANRTGRAIASARAKALGDKI